jgi:PadR family transcriptional regulator PadR
MDRLDFLQGTLEILILRTLLFGPRHGYAIAQHIRQTSDEAFAVEAGSLYPALQRLELQKLIKAKWEVGDTNRRTRVYTLTAAGRKRLSASISRWDDFVHAMALVLKPAKEEE